MSLDDGIELRIKNIFRTVIEAQGDSAHTTGHTTIEVDSRSNGNGVDIYIQKKGFDSSTPKSIRAHFDNDTVMALAHFFQRHTVLAGQYSAMLSAAAPVSTEEPTGLIDELDISPRVKGCLVAEKIFTIGQLCQWSEIDLIKTPNLGRKALNELREKLAMRGLKFRSC